MALVEGVADQVFQIAPKKFGFRPSPLWQVEQRQFLEMLKNTLQALETSSQGWKPIGFEEKFGIDDTPPLVIKLGREDIRLRGYIDRVDRNAAGELRVIDYKTGGSHLSKRDFDEGRRLQLPIYGLAAQEALGLGEVVEGFYWAIRDAKSSSFKLSNYETEDAEGFEAALGVLQKHLFRILSGIHGGVFPPKPPHGGCPSYCPAAGWCWRYQAGW
jgi:RecB family exonuclease